MISEREARDRIAAAALPLAPVRIPLSESLGHVLAEHVTSDLDSPPHDKALVDGFAVRSADFADADAAKLKVNERVTAGQNPTMPLEPGQATEIMTGAPLPAGCDAVVMVEQSERDGDWVRLEGGAKPEQNLLRAGASMRKGDLVVQTGAVIRAVEIGVFAEVGCTRPLVQPRAQVAVLSTGDELVDASESPGPGQIRNSNGPMLEAQIRAGGGVPVVLGAVSDDVGVLETKIRAGLESDILVLSGGVSAGVLDLVPPTLQRCGVDQVFHKVLIKPGKPIWFGVLESGERRKLVFGLPGNPVGSLVCFERFVKPAMRAVCGHVNSFEDVFFQAALSESFTHRGPRPTYRPAIATGASVEVIRWQGSADLRALADANCLIAFPAGDETHVTGETVSCVPI